MVRKSVKFPTTYNNFKAILWVGDAQWSSKLRPSNAFSCESDSLIAHTCSTLGIFLNLHYLDACAIIYLEIVRKSVKLSRKTEISKQSYERLRAIVFAHLRRLKFSLLCKLVPPCSYISLERSWKTLRHTAISRQSYDWIMHNSLPNLGHQMHVLWCHHRARFSLLCKLVPPYSYISFRNSVKLSTTYCNFKAIVWVGNYTQ